MKWISEETLKDCQIFRYSKMENGKEGVRPVTVDELPGIEFDIDYSKINALKNPCTSCPTPETDCSECVV